MKRRELVVICSFFLLAFTVIGAYAGTIGVNDLFGFTNGYGFTWLNSTNVQADEYFLNSVNKTDIFAYPQQDYSYIVWEDAGVFYYKTGDTGVVTNAGADSETAINAAIALAPVHSWVIIIGDITIDNPITLSDHVSIRFDRIRNNGSGYAFENPNKGAAYVRNFELQGNYINCVAGSQGSGIDLKDCILVDANIGWLQGDNNYTGTIGVNFAATAGGVAGYWNKIRIGYLSDFDENIKTGTNANVIDIHIDRMNEAGSYGLNFDAGSDITAYVGDIAEAGIACVRINTGDVQIKTKIEAPDNIVTADCLLITATGDDYYIDIEIDNDGAGAKFNISNYDGIIRYRGMMYGVQETLLFDTDVEANKNNHKIFSVLNNIYRDSCSIRINTYGVFLSVAPGVGESANFTITTNEGADQMPNNILGADTNEKNTTPVSHTLSSNLLHFYYDSSGGCAVSEAYITVVIQRIPIG